jgi:beta-lactamase class C
MRLHVAGAAIACLSLSVLPLVKVHASEDAKPGIGAIVGAAITPVMKQYGIPGMAVGVVSGGHEYVFTYGVVSKVTSLPVTDNTLFEIGSVSKIFNATLASYAQLEGDLSLSDMASQYLPSLRGTAFDKVSLIELGTYTPGGMPLQVLDGIDNNAKLFAYYMAWKPAYAPGTVRTYSNLSIGLLGFIAAKTMHADYATLLQNQMFPALGLHHSFMSIPASEAANYAQGYEDDDTPVRMTFDPLTPETGGVRITAGDLLRFLAINMGDVSVDTAWQRAVTATHTGYFQTKSGGMVQDLVWEQYRWPVTLSALEASNSYGVILDPHPVAVISPPLPPRMDVLLDKTGSTNGFGAYVALIPADGVAVVLLANKNYPIPARVSVAYQILTRLNANIPRLATPSAKN